MKNILYLGVIDWFWIKQRPQHFTEILGYKHKVTYLCRRSWNSNINIVSKHSLSDQNLGSKKFNINENLEVIRKRLIPAERKIELLRYINNYYMRSFIKKLNIRNNYDVIIISHPELFQYIDKEAFKSQIVIYDCMDKHKEFEGVERERIIYYENMLLKRANYIIVSSDNLYEYILTYNKEYASKLFKINNGVDTNVFDANKINPENEVDIIRQNDKIKIGYIGTVSKWVDIDLISKVAKEDKNKDFYFIGPIDKSINVDDYKDIDNLFFTGAQPYYSIPNILKKLDITIMPFIENELIRSVNPVKIYEYMAFGKPIITLDYNEIKKFEPLIYTYRTPEQFKDCIYKCLTEDIAKAYLRIEYAKNNTWETRVKRMESIAKI